MVQFQVGGGCGTAGPVHLRTRESNLALHADNAVPRAGLVVSLTLCGSVAEFEGFARIKIDLFKSVGAGKDLVELNTCRDAPGTGPKTLILAWTFQMRQV